EVTFENTGISSSRKSGQHGGDINITVRSGSDINVGTGMTSVANAHGIVAQSLGSSGGLRSDGDKLVFDGKNSSVSDGYGGAIIITVENNASVFTDATGGIGILAHSSGKYANHDKKGITVQVDGDVIGGRTGNSPITGNHLDGVGVMVMGGAVKDSGFANTINVNGRVMLADSGAKGYGIKTDYGITNINNFGLIQGSVDMGSTPGTLTNNQSGTLEMGNIYRVGNNSLHNYGTLQVGTEQSVSTTTLYGTMHQYEGGRLVFTVDAAASGAKHDKLIVNGTANLGGEVQVYANTLLPGSYSFIDATNLNFTGRFADSLIYDWVPVVSTTGLSAGPTANFNGAHLNLTGTAASLADYIARGWQSADVAKAGLFAHLHHVETTEEYQETLEQLGGQQFQAQTQQMVASSFGGFNDALRCPRDGTGVRRAGEGCVWAEAAGNHTRQTEQSENLGFRSEGGGVRMGAQRALNDVVTLGSAFGVNRNRLTSTGFSSKGNTFDATVSLSRDVESWTFSGAVMAAHGRFHNDRSVDFGSGGASRGLNATYSSRSTTTLLGARLRAAYNMSFNNYYLRPLLDVDVLHSRSPSFTESDSGPLQLEVGSAKQTQIVVSPTLETGASFDVGSETLMRAYAGAGVSFYSNLRHSSQNRFNKALTSSGTFTSEQETPSVLGRLSLGVEFAGEDNLGFSAEYGLQAGGGYRSQNLNARLTYRF
ncbi:MAG: autotransporter domain-containing protein, partial [Pusillimonas sp.]|nr:autotransporter domain-containing protein [Pusillimonas sp.]